MGNGLPRRPVGPPYPFCPFGTFPLDKGNRPRNDRLSRQSRLPPWGRCPRRGRRGIPRQKRNPPAGDGLPRRCAPRNDVELGIDFFPYHVILKIKRGAAGRRESLSSYRVTAERPSLWRLLLFYLENQRNDGYDQNTEVKEIGIRDHDITPLRCSGGGKEVSASSRRRGLPPTEYWQRQRISMRRGYYSTFCRIWQG